MTQALQLGMESLLKAAGSHEREIARLVPIAQSIAQERGTVTISEVREAAGLLEGRGRALSYLGAVMKAAGLVPTNEWRRSEIPGTHGNLNRVFRMSR